MTGTIGLRKTNLSIGRDFLRLVLVAALIAGCSQGPDSKPAATIRLSGEASFPVTPDSALADPLQAPETSFASFTLTIAASSALKPGGGIRVEPGYLFHDQPLIGEDVRYGFSGIQVMDPAAANYLSVHAERRNVIVRPVAGRTVGTSFEIIFLEGLPADQKVAFHFGDRSGGGPGLAVPPWPMKIRMLTFIDTEGQGDFRLAAGDHPEIEAYASGADRFKVIGPSVTFSPEIRVRIVPMRGSSGLHSSALPVKDYAGPIHLYLDADRTTNAGTGTIRKGDNFLDLTVKLPAAGLFDITARDESRDLSGTSNPILYLDGSGMAWNEIVPAHKDSSEFPDLTDYFSERAIYWGSLQNHTAVGGHAASVPEEAYRCAQEEGALDFCAITDHSSNPAFSWKMLRELPDAYNIPGRFVAFAGYEWTSARYGHRHVIFKEGKDSIACSESPTDDPAEFYAPDLATFARHSGGDPNALLIVHHTRRRLDPAVQGFCFGDYQALERQRLFEIFSWQGGGEGAADDLLINGRADRTYPSGSGFRDTLRAGYRFGVTSDSDAHMGRPGIATAVRRKNGLRYGYSGLTAVLAPALDRASIFEALENRKCYGTTGARIVMTFKVGAGIAGDEITCNEKTVPLETLVIGTAPIETIQVIANSGSPVHEEHPDARAALVRIPVPASSAGEAVSYYLRVVQTDGHMAWSSPVWVESNPGGASGN